MIKKPEPYHKTLGAKAFDHYGPWAFAAIAIALLALSGCATDPSMIKAAPVATGCSTSDASQLAMMEQTQKRVATNDAISVLLIGVPVSALTGTNQTKEIARLKACVNGAS